MQVPPTLKQPPVKLMPLAAVEVAAVEVRLNVVASMPPAKVEVPAPCTASVPVVVAPPDIVSPPACVPLPTVEDANAVSPALNCVSVDVALPAAWKGYAAATWAGVA